MLKRSTTLLLAAIHRSFYPVRKEMLINAGCMAFCIALAVFIAKFANFPAPYWAGVSAMMVVTPTLSGIIRKGLMRLIGTCLGAFLGLMVIKLGIGEMPWLFFCLLFISIAAPLWQMHGSRYPYAWLIGGITCDMVMLAGLLHPEHTLAYAQTRALEITIGVTTSMVVYSLLAVVGKVSYQVEIKEQRSRPLHALAGSRARAALVAGLAGCTAAGIWIGCHFTIGIEQSVTSIWVLSYCGTAFDTYHKGLQRFAGCAVGGIIGALLLLIPAAFPVFLALVFAVSLVGCMIQNGPIHGRYFGLQTAFVFLMIYADAQGSEMIMFRLMSIIAGMILVIGFSYGAAKLARVFLKV